MFNPELLKILVCPAGKKELKHEGSYLVCTCCGLKFPFVDGVPVLIIEEAILPESVSSLNDLPCIQHN